MDHLQQRRDQLDSGLLPATWEPLNTSRVPTGISMLDDLMQGGTEPGEVNVLLGPTGCGKTTLGMQIACSTAQQEYQRVENALQSVGKLSLHFCYGEGLRSMQIQAMCYGAQIKKSRLERMRGYSDLSTSANPLEYDRQFVHGANPVVGEQERLRRARAWIQANLRFVDCSNGSVPRRGQSGILEICEIIESCLLESGRELGTVVIDSAGLLVNRYVRTIDGDLTEQTEAELHTFVDRVYHRIAKPHKASAWILHHLDGPASRLPPTKTAKHRHADGCSGFGRLASFVFVMSNVDINTKACVIEAPKTRDGEPSQPKRIRCQLNGEFGEFVPAP